MSVISNNINDRIAAMLGLETEGLVSFSIHFDPNSLVELKARYYPKECPLVESVTTLVEHTRPKDA